MVFVCSKEQAKKLYPLQYCPECRDAAAGERRRNPLRENLGGSPGGAASSATMRAGARFLLVPGIRLAKALRDLVRFWGQLLETSFRIPRHPTTSELPLREVIC